MRGSIKWQVNQVFQTINQIGSSKHMAKMEARAEGHTTWHEIGKNIDIYSYSTLDLYRDVAKDLMNYAKEQFSIKDIEKLNSEVVKSFLETKIADGVKYSTFQTYAAALEKLEVALNKYSEINDKGNTYNFSETIREIRQEAREVLDRSVETRAYEDPKGLIENIKDEKFQILAEVQYNGGFRISEINHVSPEQFKENNIFEVWDGKGGKDREIQLPENVYSEFKELVENNINENYNKFTFDENQYREAIKEGAELSGQEYHGSHGLRWNFAQETFAELQESGFSYEESLQEVSNLLGHERPDITEHYLL